MGGGLGTMVLLESSGSGFHNLISGPSLLHYLVLRNSQQFLLRFVDAAMLLVEVEDV